MTGGRSAHLAMYGIVGAAMYLVVGVMIAASYTVISSGWLVTLVGTWLIGAGVGAVMWRRTVWVPLLASILLSTLWMTVFFGSR